MSIDLSLVLQYAVIAVAVAISAWVVLRKQFPRAERCLRIWLALPLLRAGGPTWRHALGRRIAPALSAGGDPACGGCNDCRPGPRRSA